MTDTAHTPTPWKLMKNGRIAGPHIQLARGYQDVLGMITMNGDHQNMRANAAFIVKAVNAHDVLVEALNYARSELEAYELAATGEGYNNLAINSALELAEHSEPMERGE
jgi:hypothetical protein